MAASLLGEIMKQWENFPRKPYGKSGDAYQVGENYVVFKDGSFFRITKDGALKKRYGTVDELGYVRVYIGNRQYARLHRVVALCFCENSRGCTEVNHINGIKTDNRADNLEWCTRGENIRHAHKLGLKTPCNKGRDAVVKYQHEHRRFSEEQVRYIRSSGKTVNELKNEFGVDHQSIRQIINCKSYRDVI